MIRSSSRLRDPWILMPIVIGVVLFFFVTGGKILNPLYVDWLMKGDPAQHLIGWQFFRSTPLLQWPIGANRAFGMELGSSIVFSDSIPLMAFLFKPFNAILPEQFQYTGIWILICFCLQAYFAWKLLSLFVKDKILLIIGCLFFAMAPASVWRLHAHFALFSHWVLLAALYLYFSTRFSKLRWAALLIGGVLIHAYLVVMLLAIASADLVQRRWLKQISTVHVAGYAFTGLVLVALVMWAAGYFMVGAGVADIGFGFYRMNLLALIDPDDLWSKVIPDQTLTAGDYEGFNYLGAGIIGLVLFSMAALLIKPTHQGYRAATKVPLILLSISLSMYAISSHIAVGQSEVFAFALPPLADRITNTFRASGRFFWPVYYLIYFTVFYILMTRLKVKLAIALTSLMLVFQVWDTANAWSFFRVKMTDTPAWDSPMTSSLWKDFSQRYKSVILVLPGSLSTDWIPLAQFSATHRMITNTGYFARVDPLVKLQMQDHLKQTVALHQYDPDSIYIFEDDALWARASQSVAEDDVAGVLDGFRFLAPRLKRCASCDISAVVSVVDSNKTPYSSGVLSFQPGGSGVKFLSSGWSAPEGAGTWSEQRSASINLELPNVPKRKLALYLTARAFLSNAHPLQDIEVSINGTPLKTVRYFLPDPSGLRVIPIPESLDLSASEHLQVNFDFKNAITPLELGLFIDGRPLGINIQSLELKSIY